MAKLPLKKTTLRITKETRRLMTNQARYGIVTEEDGAEALKLKYPELHSLTHFNVITGTLTAFVLLFIVAISVS